MTNSVSDLNLIGGALCLDFVNTVDWRLSSKPEEYLQDYPNIVEWSKLAGILNPSVAARLTDLGSRRKQKSEKVWKEALLLRELLHRVFTHHAQASDLKNFNSALNRMNQQRQLTAGRQGYQWSWKSFEENLDCMLWPILQSAADLLTSSKLKHVRMCAGSGCGWLFLDLSRSHSRRWCNMSSCGNRAKVLRHYYRVNKDAKPRENRRISRRHNNGMS
jgi:predicted RNA-binding Zn ribbon-like protein